MSFELSRSQPIELQVKTGPAAGKSYPINAPRIMVGRRRGDIIIKDPEISGTHALLEVDAQGNVSITDLDSTNGTFVNGKRVKKAVLAPGDRVTLGQTKIAISMDDEAAEAPPTRAVVVQPSPTQVGPTAVSQPPGASAMASDFDVEGIGALISEELQGFSEDTDSLIMDLARADEELKLPFRTNLYVEFLEGDQVGSKIQFSKGNIVIGRLNADVVVKDSDVSRRHALIEAFTKDKIFIKDLASTNGTYVNGQRITYEKLRNGDTIRVGRSVLKFIVEELQ